VFPAPLVHADLASAAALAAADQQRAAALVEVVLCQRERLLQPQPGAPEDDDNRPQAPAVTVIARVAHHGHELVHGGRVCRIPHAFVARRSTGVVAGHRHR
jgi:hypothetical protein